MLTNGSDDGHLPELFSDLQWPRIVEALHLTPRQAAVARLMCRGLKRQMIARDLGLSENTVRTHVRGLFDRVGVSSRIGLIVHLVLAERALRLPSVQWPNGGAEH